MAISPSGLRVHGEKEQMQFTSRFSGVPSADPDTDASFRATSRTCPQSRSAFPWRAGPGGTYGQGGAGEGGTTAAPFHLAVHQTSCLPISSCFQGKIYHRWFFHSSVWGALQSGPVSGYQIWENEHCRNTEKIKATSQRGRSDKQDHRGAVSVPGENSSSGEVTPTQASGKHG